MRPFLRKLMKILIQYPDGSIKLDRGHGVEHLDAMAARAVPPSVDGPVAEAEPGPEPPKKPAAKKRKG